MRPLLALKCSVGASIVCLGAWRGLADHTVQCAKERQPEPQAYAVGLIADVQWADVDDGWNFAHTSKRCFRGALNQLSRAVDWWDSQDLAAVAQLGDLIDGRNAALGASEAALEGALKHLRRLRVPVLHTIGNHELYNFDRHTLSARLGHGKPDCFYFSFRAAEGHRIIVLDSFCESVNGWPEGDPRREAALRTLAEKNPNDVMNSPNNWFVGLSGVERRFVPYNGGFGDAQIAWLRGELVAAAGARERVVVLSHGIIHPKACDGTTMVWDYDKALHEVHSAGCVAAVVCGHDHKGGYHLDPHGVHHITLCSPLNEGDDGSAFGVLHMFADHMELRGPSLANLLPAHERLPAVLPSADDACLRMRFEFPHSKRVHP